MKQKRKKTSSQIICQLFQLPHAETIYQDYSCCYIGAISYFGRIFIGQEHICFNSNMFGITKQFSIIIDNITKLELDRKKIIGTCKNAKGVEESFVFSNFVNVQFAYKLMHGLWKGERIEAKILGSNQEDKDGQLDDSNMEIDFFNKQVSLSDKQTLAKINFPCSIEQYFDFFLSDDASLLSAADFLKYKSAQNIKATKWVKNQEMGTYVREVSAVIKVTGVPLRSTARLHQIQSMSKTDKHIVISIVTQMSDVPYAAYFTVETSHQINYVDDKKCSLQVQAWLTFNKSTIMKRMIVDKSAKDLADDVALWIKIVQQRLKSKVKRGSGDKAEIEGNLEYQNVESTAIDFTRILEEDLDKKQRESDGVSSSQLKTMERKVNLLIALVVLLIAMNVTSFLK